MWEGIVEKLLTRYLSEYVEGIEREKLQVGLLRGDIELTDLTIKPEAADALELGCTVLFGRIGRLSIGISWSKWMAQNYDLRVKVEHVHVLLKPRVPDTPKSVTQLRVELRAAKEREILKRENAILEVMRSSQEDDNGAKNSSFLMKVTNRLIRNIEIEVLDVHVAFHDAVRGFSLGCLLDVGSLLSCAPIPVTENRGSKPQAAQNFQAASLLSSESVSKCVQLRGLSFYGGTSILPEWKNLVKAFSEKNNSLLRLLACQLLIKMQASLPVVESSRLTVDVSANAYDSLQVDEQEKLRADSRPVVHLADPLRHETTSNFQGARTALLTQDDDNIYPANSSSPLLSVTHRTELASKNYREDVDHKRDPLLPFDYILLPLHLCFYFTSDFSKKLVSATLLVGKQSQGVTLGRSYVKMMVELSRNTTEYRRYCRKILMAKSHLVRLDPEGISSETRGVFTTLYTKKLRYEADITGNRGPLSPSENERLKLLHDVVSVRHLAKWRAACLIELEKLVREKKTRVQEELAEARKRQSWWGWATQGSKVVESAVLEKIQQRDQSLLTEDEAKFMSEAVKTEIAVDSVEGPTTFQLTFKLPQFAIAFHEDHQDRRFADSAAPNSTLKGAKPSNKTQPPFIELDLHNVKAKAYVRTCVDRHDKETFEWRWSFLMSDFHVRHCGAVIITLGGQQDSPLLLEDVDGHPFPFSSHEVMSSNFLFGNKRRSPNQDTADAEYDRNQHYMAREPLKKGSSPFPDLLFSTTGNEGQRQQFPLSKKIATLWDFEHNVSRTRSVYGALIRVAPLEILFQPELLREIISFFIFDVAPEQGRLEYSVSTEMFKDQEALEDGSGQLLYDGMVENYERLCVAAHEKCPDLINVDIMLCAPIVYYQSVERWGAVVHFGQFRLNTNESCTFSELTFKIEMNEMQITCVSKTGKSIPILRPIPIEFHFRYRPAAYYLALDLLFHELYTEINPEAFQIFLGILTNIFCSFSRKTYNDFDSSVTSTTALPSSKAEKEENVPNFLIRPDEPQRLLLSTQSSSDIASLSDVDDTSAVEIDDMDDEKPQALSDPSAIEERAQDYRLTCVLTVFVRRIGFSMFNLMSTEVLRAGAVNLAWTTYITRSSLNGAETRSTVQLEAVFASDPSTRTPLFLTLHQNALNLDNDELFGHVHRKTTPSFFRSAQKSAGSLFSFSEDESLEHGFSMDRKPDAECEDERDFTAGSSFETAAASEAPDVDCGLASLKRITSQSSGFSEKSKVFGPAARRAKRLQYGGNSFVLRYISTPFPSINMDVKASCEIHWQKKSIKQVLTAMQELRALADEAFESQIKVLRQSAVDNTRRPDAFLSVETVSALERTLRLMKSTIGIGDLGVPETEMQLDGTTDQLSPPIHDVNPAEVAYGLNSDGSLPAFGDPTATIAFRCSVRFLTASFCFWQEGNQFGHSSLQHVVIEYTRLSSEDAELLLSVGQIGLTLEGRRIVSSAAEPLLEKLVPQHAQQANDEMQDSPSSSTERLDGLRNNASDFPKGWMSSDTEKGDSGFEAPVFRGRLKFYKSCDSSTKRSPSYNACMSGHLSQLTYVYFQKDLNKLLTYLSDGILDVIFWKSYEAAYNLASSSYFLFFSRVDCPLFILPEDKTCIPQFPSFYELSTTFDSLTGKTTNNSSKTGVGCYVAFDLGRLSVRNGYTLRPIGRRVKSNHVTAESENSTELCKSIASTLYLELEGLSASMEHHDRFNFFSPNVTGNVLKQVNGKGKVRLGDPLLVDFHFSEFCLSFNREQLTLLIDILNENFAGLGYNPSAIELRKEQSNSPFSTNFANDDLHSKNDCSQPGSSYENQHAEEDLVQLLQTPPLRVSTRITIDALLLNASFGPDTPLTQLNTRKIFVACDASLYCLYITYQFSVLAESLLFLDTRKESKNVYKRFLECFPHTREEEEEELAQTRTSNHLNYGPPNTEYHYGEDPPGTHLVWMRPGIELKYIDTHLSGPDTQEERVAAAEYINEKKTVVENKPLQASQNTESQDIFEFSTKGFTESIYIGFENNILTSRFSVQLTRPTLYLLTVGMQDILDWVVSSFSFSTMRRCPKPVPSVVATSIGVSPENPVVRSPLQSELERLIPQNRPFLVEIFIQQGVFNVFSKLETPNEPIIQGKGDFFFFAESVENCIIFKSIKLSDCVVCRMDIRPVHWADDAIACSVPMNGLFERNVTTDSDRFLRDMCEDDYVDGKSELSTSVDLKLRLFVPESYVIISETFSFTASGALETLFDPVTQRWYSPINKTEQDPSTPFTENAESLPLTDIRQQQKLLFSDFEPPTETNRETSVSSVGVSQLQISFSIPECSLHLSNRDLAVLLSAFRHVNADLPSVSPGTAAPPILTAELPITKNRENINADKRSSTATDAQKELSEFSSNKLLPLMAMDDEGRNSKGIRTEATYEDAVQRCSASQPWTSKIIDSHRYTHVDIHCAGVNVTFLDDSQATISPILKTKIELKSLGIYLKPDVFLIALQSVKTWTDYMSQRVGEWEPFVEQFNVSFTYKSETTERIKKPRSSSPLLIPRKQLESKVGSRLTVQPCQVSFNFFSLKSISSVFQQQTSTDMSFYPSNRQVLYSPPQSGVSKNPIVSREWSNFSPQLWFVLVSGSPLWINVTPQMCQLLTWFTSALMDTLRAPSLAMPCRSGQDEVFCKSSVIERGSQSQSLLKSEGKETTGLDGQNDEFLDEDASTSMYRYINLTGETFVAFSFKENECNSNLRKDQRNRSTTLTKVSRSADSLANAQSGNPSNDRTLSKASPAPSSLDTSRVSQIGSVMRLVPTVRPRSADHLASGHTTTEARHRRRKRKHINVFLCSAAPTEAVDRLHTFLPQVPPAVLTRNLLVTRDEETTLNTFLSIQQIQDCAGCRSDDERVQTALQHVDPTPAYIGEFPKQLQVVPLVLSKASTVLLPPPCKMIDEQYVHKVSDPRLHRRALKSHQEGNFSSTLCSNVPLDFKDSPQSVGIVISPHPSYKLFLLTSSIRVVNQSGIPLEVAFLKDGRTPILLHNAQKCCAPASLLQDYRKGNKNYCYLDSAGPVKPITQRQSGYPYLTTIPPEVVKYYETDSPRYTMFLPDDNVLSVPRGAFVTPERVIVVFRPAAFGVKECQKRLSELTEAGRPPKANSAFLEPAVPVIAPELGWAAALDIEISNHLKCNSRFYVRSCRHAATDSQLPPKAHGRRDDHSSRDDSLPKKKGLITLTSKTENLYFTVIRNETLTPPPTRIPLVDVSIFPSFTVVNACPTPLDIFLMSESKVPQVDPSSSQSSAVSMSSSFFSTIHSKIDNQQSPPVRLTLIPFTIFHVYNIHPAATGTLIRMKLRFGLIGDSEWSHSVRFVHPLPKEDVVTRFLLQCGGYSVTEVEIYKQPHDFAEYIPAVYKDQQACVLSCPRWFLDRTGFGVRACELGTGLSGSFPVVDGIGLLGNSQNPTVELVLPVSESSGSRHSLAEKGSGDRYPRCVGEIPAVGAFSNANIVTPSRYYTFCLQTFRVNPNDTGGAVARSVVVAPKYVLTNALETVVVSIRQSYLPGDGCSAPLAVAKPGETVPLYWKQQREKLFFQFKAGSDYAWSGSVLPSEEHVGGHDIAVLNIKERRHVLFHIQIVPENGVISVILRCVSDPLRSSSCSIVLRNHLDATSIVFRAYHPHSTALPNTTSARALSIYAGHEERRSNPRILTAVSSVKLTESAASANPSQDAWFRAAPHNDVLLAWPFPFTQSAFACDVTLLNDADEPLRQPATFLINPRWRNRKCLEIREAKLPYRCFIFLETRGSTLTIDVLHEHFGSVSLPCQATLHNSLAGRRLTLPPEHLLSSKVVAPCNLQFVFSFSQIGVSFVSDELREELLFAEASVVCGVLLQHNDNQIFEFCVGDIQIDSQLEESERPVLLANRHGGTPMTAPVRTERKTLIPEAYDLSDLLPCSSHILSHFAIPARAKPDLSIMKGTQRQVSVSAPSLLPPAGAASKPRTHRYTEEPRVFMQFFVEREAISSSDLHLRKVHMSLDDLEVDIDAEMLNGLQHFAKECLDIFGFYHSIGIPRSVASQWKTTPLHQNYQPTVPGKVIVLDEMCISKFTVIVWCSLLLDKINFMSDFLKMGLRILMVSQSLELKGAPISFEPEVVNNSMRGSLSTLLLMLKGRYLDQIISSIGVVLGYSSLANIPRAPLDIVRGTVGFGLSVADNVTSGLGSLLSNLTFDAEYIAQRQKSSRTPHSVKDGLTSATRDLKEGFLSLGDIVTKPFGGAQKDGFTGLIKGLGKGVVGTLIKPVDKLGQAVSSVASGIRAEYVTRPLGGYKCRTVRRRKPRMLSGAEGQIRPYDVSEAELRESLALKIAKDVVLSLTVFIREVPPAQHLVLLIYPTRLSFVDLYAGRSRLDLKEDGTVVSDSKDTGRNWSSRPVATTPQSSVGRAHMLWSLDANQITAVRASSHGVTIHTAQRVRQIPCRKGTMIKKLYEEIVKSQQRAKAVLELEKITEWIGVSDDS